MKKMEFIELNAQELKSVNGGKVPMWLYFVSPVGAYLLDRFEKGCECDII